MSSTAYKKYKETAIQSASREKILLMLYEGAIKFIKLAIQAVEKKQIKEKCENIGRAYDIILELNNSLDHKVGGQISAQLEQLYHYMTEQLIKANMNGDTEALKVVLKLLETLHEGWVQAIQKLKSEVKE
jgi:flagellar protein FliS